MEHNASNESNLEPNDDYPPYNIHLHVFLMSILLSYIPIIAVSSTLVMSAVIFVKQLDHAHNSILFSISVMDMIIGLVIIPIHVLIGIPHTRRLVNSSQFLPGFCYTLIGTVNLIYLAYLALLGFDTLIQLKYHIFYWKHSSNKKAITIIGCIAVVYFGINFLAFGISISPISQNLLAKMKIFKKYFHDISLYSFLILSLVFGISVTCLSWKRVRRPSERITIVLLMAYIVFYSPTLYFMFVIRDNPDTSRGQIEMWLFIGRIGRYLSCATNGIFIYLTRPVYRKAFRYFIKTKPTHWKRIEKSFSIKPDAVVTRATVTQKIEDENDQPSPEPSLSIENLTSSITGSKSIKSSKSSKSIKSSKSTKSSKSHRSTLSNQGSLHLALSFE